MKRLTKVTIFLSFITLLWILIKNQIHDFTLWLLIPIAAIALFGVYSAITILSKVFLLKDFPED